MLVGRLAGALALGALLVGRLAGALARLGGRSLGLLHRRLLLLLGRLLLLGPLLDLAQRRLPSRRTHLGLLVAPLLDLLERRADDGLGGRLVHLPSLLALRLLKRALLVHPAEELRPGDLARVQPLHEERLGLAADKLERLLISTNVQDAMARVDPGPAETADVGLDDHGRKPGC